MEGPYYDDNERLIEDKLGEGIDPAKYPGSSLEHHHELVGSRLVH